MAKIKINKTYEKVLVLWNVSKILCHPLKGMLFLGCSLSSGLEQMTLQFFCFLHALVIFKEGLGLWTQTVCDWIIIIGLVQADVNNQGSWSPNLLKLFNISAVKAVSSIFCLDQIRQKVLPDNFIWINVRKNTF